MTIIIQRDDDPELVIKIIEDNDDESPFFLVVIAAGLLDRNVMIIIVILSRGDSRPRRGGCPNGRSRSLDIIIILLRRFNNPGSCSPLINHSPSIHFGHIDQANVRSITLANLTSVQFSQHLV